MTLVARMFFALVWLVNGLWAKVMGGVPRHEEIVARILGETWSRELIIAIGVTEIGMAAWILSGWRSRWCAIAQIAAVMMMNVIEWVFARDLLLFGGWNFVVALAYVALVARVELRRPS